MTTTRDRLERRRHRSPWRVLLVVVCAVLLALAAAAGVAVLALPPVLADTPRERFEVPAAVVVHDAGAHASVELSAGWLAIGVGPFLPTDRARLVSPDGVYRLELALLGTDAAAPTTAMNTPAATAPAPTAGAADADPAEAATPTTSTTDAPSALDTLLTERGLAEAVGSAAWSRETLTSGSTVRYTTVEHEGAAVTVAVVSAADPTISAELALIASTPLDDAARYRTVTADLVGSAVVSRTEEARS